MPRREHPREDLLREATAYVDRMELDLRDLGERAFVGFRRSGAVSFYFGEDQDRVIQFNTRGELRRLYWRGAKYKADRGRLVRIMRPTPQRRVQLVAQSAETGETKLLLRHVERQLHELAQALDTENVTIRGEVCAGGQGVAARIRDWLQARANPIRVAVSGRVD